MRQTHSSKRKRFAHRPTRQLHADHCPPESAPGCEVYLDLQSTACGPALRAPAVLSSASIAQKSARRKAPKRPAFPRDGKQSSSLSCVLGYTSKVLDKHILVSSNSSWPRLAFTRRK